MTFTTWTSIPAAVGFRAVVSGHSHRASVVERGGVLFVNPGSAGPRRFRLPVTVAHLESRGSTLLARIIEIETCDPPPSSESPGAGVGAKLCRGGR